MHELYTKIYQAKAALEAAKRSGNGVSGMSTRLSNLLFNHVNEIMEALKTAESSAKKVSALERDVESLQAALDEADARAKTAVAGKPAKEKA